MLELINKEQEMNKYFIALPYSAVDTPVYGSEFSNIYQKIIFTILSKLFCSLHSPIAFNLFCPNEEI